ncbi:hypothetical protein LG3211_3650 [Lysobacter gummosus]|nr:hypothetical protein LG3211_3650 [Lysobacter gummosus]
MAWRHGETSCVIGCAVRRARRRKARDGKKNGPALRRAVDSNQALGTGALRLLR